MTASDFQTGGLLVSSVPASGRSRSGEVRVLQRTAVQTQRTKRNDPGRRKISCLLRRGRGHRKAVCLQLGFEREKEAFRLDELHIRRVHAFGGNFHGGARVRGECGFFASLRHW